MSFINIASDNIKICDSELCSFGALKAGCCWRI